MVGVDMLIRSVEFQDSFARAPVEGARQLSLDLHRPDIIQGQIASTNAQQMVLDQGRPLAFDQTEDKVIHPEQKGVTERPQARERRRQKQEPEEGENHPPHIGTTGTKVDFVA